MKLEELNQLIESTVRKVMREELREILTEAVEIASRPGQVPTKKVEEKRRFTKQNKNLEDILQETVQSMTGEDYKRLIAKPEESVSQVDMSSELPSFALNAKAVLDASFKKDIDRNALSS